MKTKLSPLYCVYWQYAYWDYPYEKKEYFSNIDEAYDFASDLMDSGECLYVNVKVI